MPDETIAPPVVPQRNPIFHKKEMALICSIQLHGFNPQVIGMAEPHSRASRSLDPIRFLGQTIQSKPNVDHNESAW
jgi:hypothetical protein